MKNYILIIAALFFFINGQSQNAVTGGQTETTVAKTDTGNQKKKPDSSTSHRKPKDCWKMAGSTMLVVKDGVTTTMSTDKMLKNGTVILSGGLVVSPNGKKRQLKNGESINEQGVISNTAKDRPKGQANK